jgi:hypothetical protein
MPWVDEDFVVDTTTGLEWWRTLALTYPPWLACTKNIQESPPLLVNATEEKSKCD